MKTKLRKYLKKIIKEKNKEDNEKVEVVSPYLLSKEEVDLIFRKFPKLKTEQTTFRVDPTLLAGIQIKKGSNLVDLSLDSFLTSLTKEAYEITG